MHGAKYEKSSQHRKRKLSGDCPARWRKGRWPTKNKNKKRDLFKGLAGGFMLPACSRTESGRQEHEQNSTNRSHRSIARRGRCPKLCSKSIRRLLTEHLRE